MVPFRRTATASPESSGGKAEKVSARRRARSLSARCRPPASDAILAPYSYAPAPWRPRYRSRMLARRIARQSLRRPGRNATVDANALPPPLLLLNRLQRRTQNGGTDDRDFGSSAAVVLPAVVGAPGPLPCPWTVRAAAPVEEPKLLPMGEDRSHRGGSSLHDPACRNGAHRHPSGNPRGA